MDIRYSVNQRDVKRYTSQELRNEFLIEKGYASKELIPTLRRWQSPLQGHPDMKKLPGVEMSTGSLGQGLSAANGMALSAKI